MDVTNEQRLLALMVRGALGPGALVHRDDLPLLFPDLAPDAALDLFPNASEHPFHRWGSVLARLGPPREENTHTEPYAAAPSVGGDDLLGPAALAAALDVSQAAVHRWTSEGRIPHYKLGHKTVRYRLTEVLASKAQGTAAGKRQTHGREKAQKRVDGGLSVHRSGVPRADSIPAFDWTRTDEKGG